MTTQPLTFSSPSYETLSGKEWLVTNGLGGYASSTLSGANTRRYHGIFVPALNPPTDRIVIVSKMEETLVTEQGSWTDLSSNQYPGVIHPQGYRYVKEFTRLPIPTFRYAVDDNTVTKRICMPHNSNTTVIEYTNTGEAPITLETRPLFVHRDYHSLYTERAESNFWTEWKSTHAAVLYSHYGAPPLYFSFSKGTFKEHRTWYKNFEYQKEVYRGLDFREDCFCLGAFSTKLLPGESMYFLFTMEEGMLSQNPKALLDEEIGRVSGTANAFHGLAKLNGNASSHKEYLQFLNDLSVAADQFIVRRKSSDGHTIIAGYHWFTDWGRDTMIAMRGLVMSLGKKSLAESIIRTFLQYLDGGMLPNRFPDQGEEPEYNTIDATLWLFVVLHEYAEKFNDWKFIESIFPKLTEIIEAHLTGTRYNIHTTKEGLLFGGEGLSQLTWMDAKVGDHVVTPRQGCAVEVNALWYNALMIYNRFDKQLHRKKGYEDLANRVKENFRNYFFNGVYLNDVIIPNEYTDSSIRPNQIYALSLPYPLLEKKDGKKVLQVIKEKLLTPLGLRSLDPGHPDFVGAYGGDQWHRDTAYHQGTVWHFLLGEYWLACLSLNGSASDSKNEVLTMMKPVMQHFYKEDCIHGISEIFDGTSPGAGRGCVQQAWSVGMTLKVLSDMLHPTPHKIPSFRKQTVKS